MFSFFRQTFREWARNGPRTGARFRPVRRLECESLEDRMLLSLSGAQLFANSLPAADRAIVASSPGGHSVVAWEVADRSTDHDIKAQIFDASGNKVGGVLSVASGPKNQYDPTVAVNASGQFVVAWMADFSTTDTDTNIHATLFKANGTPVKADFDVAETPKREYNPTAGIDARGDFVVSFTLQDNGSDTNVLAALFNSNATPLRTVNVAVTAAPEVNTGITVNPSGTFAVSYTSSGTHMIRHFSSTGQPLDAGVRVTTPTPTPTPTPRPPAPPPPPTLDGTLGGGYAPVSAGTGKGTRFDLMAIGDLAGLGETTISGDLLSTGSARSSDATGVLTLQDANGTVTLSLAGPAQGPFAALPTQFHFTVSSGTGAFAHLHSSGTVTVHLTPANHTLTLAIVPSST